MQPGKLDIGEGQDAQRHIVVLTGELDIVTAPALERAVSAALSASPRELVLDVRELSFVDSTGFRALLAVKERCLKDGVGFAMTRGPEAVQRVFGGSGVLKRLPFV
jgi:anti-anti-sigma factor